jgi:hypothetical protein
MEAGSTLGAGASSREVARNLLYVLTGEVGMGEEDGPVDQADTNLRTATCAVHQCPEAYEIE